MENNKVQGEQPKSSQIDELLADRAARYRVEEDDDQRQMKAMGVEREFGYVVMSDNTRLSYVIYRKVDVPRQPIILEFSPYMIGSVRFSGLSYGYGRNPQFWLNNGFAYAGVDIRGTTCSEGELSLFSPQNTSDGKEVVEWLGSQPWADGVGMVGTSYPGHMAMFAAAGQPTHLKAIAVAAVTGNLYNDACFPGGLFATSFLPWWSAADSSEGAYRRRFWGDQDADIERARTNNALTYRELIDHPTQDEFWVSRSIETFAHRIEVPVLLIQGFQDDATSISGGIGSWQLVKSPHKKMLLQTGAHRVADRDLSHAEILRFLAHHLLGAQNGVDREPPVRIWWEVYDAFGAFMKYPNPATEQPNWQTGHLAWPPEGTQSVTFNLSGDGALSLDAPKPMSDDGARRYMFPAGSELHADNIQFAVTPEPHGCLYYRTERLVEDLTILGGSKLDFYVSSENEDTDFMIVLHDIDESGNVIFIQKAYLRASSRGLNVNSSSGERQIKAITGKEPLVPNQVIRITIPIPEVAYVVRRGHRLELAVMAPSNMGTPYWGFSLVNLPGYNTVFASERYPSTLTLSVSPGRNAEAPMPPHGTMDGLWCRRPDFRSRALPPLHFKQE